ncbi:hypothetical protein HYH02_013486 [Chlamydomonas schloesseri]|uniref:Uncharacterized protein n=1 Tax=Chlamydomonas schloesseri TaxID=2026947 RepID=A0A835T245_9CHLO|nr:hypothetical protein HYH02_013486 [Chlamydomonas schloesseri]|eukprot:KAG2431055.1 hypothetical protein HYH02_013486 [Chlamydomonas schloesseri]
MAQCTAHHNSAAICGDCLRLRNVAGAAAAPGHKLSVEDFTLLRSRFATLLGNAEDVAALACGWVTEQEFSGRMAARAAAILERIRRAGIEAQRRVASAAAAEGPPGGGSEAADLDSTPVQVDCSLVPFRGGVWLMCSLCFGHVDEQGVLRTSKVYCVSFTPAEPAAGAEVLETPPYGRASTSALRAARAAIAAFAADLPPAGIHAAVVRLGQGLLPLLHDSQLAMALRGTCPAAAGCQVHPSTAYRRPLAEAAAAAATGGAARQRREEELQRREEQQLQQQRQRLEALRLQVEEEDRQEAAAADREAAAAGDAAGVAASSGLVAPVLEAYLEQEPRQQQQQQQQ